MATDFLYGTRGSVVNLLTTELNSLSGTAGTLTGFGPAITPGTTYASRFQWCDLWLKIASSSGAYTSASFVNVYFVTALDGSNYPKLSGNNLAKANYFAASIAIYPATLSAEVIYEGKARVRLPNAPFKTVLENQTAVAFPASGNTLDAYPQADQY